MTFLSTTRRESINTTFYSCWRWYRGVPVFDEKFVKGEYFSRTIIFEQGLSAGKKGSFCREIKRLTTSIQIDQRSLPICCLRWIQLRWQNPTIVNVALKLIHSSRSFQSSTAEECISVSRSSAYLLVSLSNSEIIVQLTWHTRQIHLNNQDTDRKGNRCSSSMVRRDDDCVERCQGTWFSRRMQFTREQSNFMPFSDPSIPLSEWLADVQAVHSTLKEFVQVRADTA